MTKTAIETLAGFLFAATVLAMFNSASLVTWTYDLPPSAIADALGAAAEKWDEAMQACGPARMSEAIRAAFSSITDAA